MQKKFNLNQSPAQRQRDNATTPYLRTFEDHQLNSLEMCRYEFRKPFIETHWAACKATVKLLFSVHSQYLPDYLDEQMWRSRHPHSGTIIFHHIIPHWRSQHFTMERVHRGGSGLFKADKPGALGDKSHPVVSRGKARQGVWEWEISVQLLTSTCTKKIGSDKYSSRAWTLFCANIQLKKYMIQWGNVNPYPHFINV